MNISLPDDLGEQVRAAEGLNISAVCQVALRAEMSRREAAEQLSKDMKRQVIYIEGRNGVDYDGGMDVAFFGRELYYTGHAPETTVYLTQRHRIAIHDNDAQQLWEYEAFADLADSPFNEGSERGEQMVAAVAEALGEKYVRELDI